VKKILAILLGCSLPAQAITRVQPVTSGSTTDGVHGNLSGSTTCAVSFNTTPTVGNYIFVDCFSNGTETWTAPTDNQSGNAYTAVPSGVNNGTGVSLGMWYSKVAGASGTFTVTCNGSSGANFKTCLVQEYSGLAASNPVDVSTGTTGSGVTCIPQGLTTTNSNDLILGACSPANAGSGTATFTPNTNFTIQNQDTDDTNTQIGASQDQIVSVTGTYISSMTVDINSSDQWSTAVVAMKAASTSQAAGSIRGLSLKGKMTVRGKISVR